MDVASFEPLGKSSGYEDHAAMLEWCGGSFDRTALRLGDIDTAFRLFKF